MDPGTHVVSHKGPTKGLVTCHLPLTVPDDRQHCRIEIDGQAYGWTEGQALVFDDTYRHEVWNATDQSRVVLLIHVLRPMRFPGNLVRWLFLTAIKLSPFVRDARRNEIAWEEGLSGAT